MSKLPLYRLTLPSRLDAAVRGMFRRSINVLPVRRMHLTEMLRSPVATTCPPEISCIVVREGTRKFILSETSPSASSTLKTTVLRKG